MGQAPVQIEDFEGKSDFRRLEACLLGEPTDRVPHFEILIEDEHVAALLGRAGAGNTMGVGGNPAQQSVANPSIRPMCPRDYLELCEIIGQDIIFVDASWTPVKQKRPDGTVGPIDDRSIKTREDADRIIWPSDEDMEERLQYVREYVEAAKGSSIGVGLCGFALFETIYESMVGFEDFMLMSATEPELIEEMMSRSADYAVELARRAIQEGVDVIYGADDVAMKTGLFIRPEIFVELWAPHYDRVFATAREADIPILFHSDGKIDDIMDLLIDDMGVNCITPMDPTGVDYREYKKRYGHRVCLWGNIDLTWPLVGGTPADVERDVREHAQVLKPGGRWIAASSHSIVDYIPHENFLTMINAIHRYGRY